MHKEYRRGHSLMIFECNDHCFKWSHYYPVDQGIASVEDNYNIAVRADPRFKYLIRADLRPHTLTAQYKVTLACIAKQRNTTMINTTVSFIMKTAGLSEKTANFDNFKDVITQKALDTVDGGIKLMAYATLYTTTEKALQYCRLIHKLQNSNVENVNTVQQQLDEFYEDLENQWKKDIAEIYEIAESIPETLHSDKLGNDDDGDAEQPECIERMRALANLLDVPMNAIEKREDGYHFEVLGSELYWVLTDDEAEEEFDNHLEDTFYDLLEDTPIQLQNFIDKNEWKDSCMSSWERSDALNSCDGSEEWATDPITSEQFVIYRLA
jgi:hypothetical protein